jgi:uncharacterized protein (DUF58 family)
MTPGPGGGMSPGPAGLTTRGWGLLAGGAAMIVAAFLVGLPELYAIGTAALVLVAAARVWVSARAWDLTVRRAAHPSRVPAGTEAKVELMVTNPSRRSSPPVTAADPFDGGRRWARFAIAPLGAGEMRTASYRLPTSQRGVFRLGPLELETTDPFGLARAPRRGGRDASVTVHPRFEALTMRMPPSQSDLDSSRPVPVAGRGGNEFFTLRPYEPGDDLRRVHWPSSARIDDLVVRQPENRRQTRLTVAVDLRAKVHDTASLEAVLSACASIALSGLAQGVLARVLTSGGLDTGFTAGVGEGPIVLDALAAAKSHRGSELPGEWELRKSRDPVVLITTDGALEQDLVSALGNTPSQRVRVLMFERTSAAGSRGDSLGETLSLPGQSGVRHATVRVPVGSSLRRAWEAASW